MESISTTCLIDLAFDLSVDWRKLARALGLANEVQRIDVDYRKNVFEQAYRMLQIWKRRNASQATYQTLGEALSTPVLSRNDLAQKYCEGENLGSLETEIDLQGLLKNGQVSMSDIMSIANDLGKDWLWVGRLLGLEDTALDSIKDACAEMYECSYKMLELWVKRRRAQATYQCLARALLHRTVGMRDVAEKYCLDHRELQTASFVPPEEGIQQINEKMENLQLSGLSKETGVAGSPVNIPSSTEAEGSTPPVPDDCIIKNFITILPYRLWSELIIKLNPLRRGDYRDLAGEMGFNVEKILYFQSLKNPAEAVLTTCASWASIEDLCNKLKAIGRRDASSLIYAWVKTQDCKCAACNTDC